MTVLLRTCRDVPSSEHYDEVAAIAVNFVVAEGKGVRRNLAADLEATFEAIASEWLALARELANDPGGEFSHACAAAANVSDMGLMMAWSRLVRRWARERTTCLVICDDPWMFRHLREIPGVSAGRAPGLVRAEVRLALRGYAVRTARAAALMSAALLSRPGRRYFPTDASVILVYGHPASDADGRDGYFGDLMRELPRLIRVLHADCPPRRARRLAADGRTWSIHAWGGPIAAVSLINTCWRPSRSRMSGPHGWLIRRAAIREAGTAQAALIRWQILCQQSWLRSTQPAAVAWPWENHAWERCFARDARAAGVATIGYQHSVVGRMQLNYSPGSNRDGAASLPDAVFCNGQATMERLARWGVPKERLAVGGALRFPTGAPPVYDPAAPVFVALPFDGGVAGEMVAAARAAATRGLDFLVKDHPMTPFAFPDADGVRRTDVPLGRQGRVSAVVFAVTTVGLEALLAGIPTLRFRPKATVVTDILPDGMEAPTTDADSLADSLDTIRPPPAYDRDRIFAPVDMGLWRARLAQR